jgi:hypothetical protein
MSGLLPRLRFGADLRASKESFQAVDVRFEDEGFAPAASAASSRPLAPE